MIEEKKEKKSYGTSTESLALTTKSRHTIVVRAENSVWILFRSVTFEVLVSADAQSRRRVGFVEEKKAPSLYCTVYKDFM